MVKKELKLAYVLAVALLAVGVVCYSVPAKAPDRPLRIVYNTVAGRVLFNHQMHLGAAGYAISCRDCHHHPEDGSETRACGSCHSEPVAGKVAPNACFDCHEADEIEGSDIVKSADAFHTQCINCHKNYGSGPVECSGCHIQ
jgi:Class III cytochrome C family